MIDVIGIGCTKENLIEPRYGNNKCRCCSFETGWGNATENYKALMEHYDQNPGHQSGICVS